MPTPTRAAWMQAWEGDLTPSPAADRSAARVEARMRSVRYYTREATARVAQPAPETGTQEQTLPDLKVVTHRRRRWGLVAVVVGLAALLLAASIVAPILISSAATGLQSKVGQLETQQKDLTTSAAALSARISALSSPERLALQAAQLGLEPARSVHYVKTGTETAASEGDATVANR